jgi:geranylgeranyl pyrophosphate synthase
MNQNPSFQDNALRKCNKILEDYGEEIAKKSRSIMLDDSTLAELKDPLEFISKTWKDPLTPTLMVLSCKAVGGQPKKTNNVAIALSLINLSFFLWDDIIDQSSSKIFQSTLSGKYGSGTALIVGGMVSAKAFSILNNLNFNKKKKDTISELIWNLLSVMAKVEIRSLKVRKQKTYSSSSKLWKIKTESIDPETAMKIGATIGNGSRNQINSLGKYGSCLGVILGLMHDFRVSTNLTLELSNKITSGNLPYCLLIASEQSPALKKELDGLLTRNIVDQSSIKFVVEEMLKTRVFEDIEKKVCFWVKRANKALDELKENSATQTLRLFIELQPKCFVDSIPTEI